MMKNRFRNQAVVADEYTISLENKDVHSVVKNIMEILESQKDKTKLYLHLAKPKPMTVVEALDMVKLKSFNTRYKHGVKYISHKKNGYNTAGMPYEFSEQELESLRTAIHNLADDLRLV